MQDRDDNFRMDEDYLPPEVQYNPPHPDSLPSVFRPMLTEFLLPQKTDGELIIEMVEKRVRDNYLHRRRQIRELKTWLVEVRKRLRRRY